MSVQERASRKTLEGWVVSDKMDKTRVVEIRWSKRDPQYGKIINRTTKMHAHDEKNEAKSGDRVRVVSTRPISRKKTWRISDILQKAVKA